MEILHGFRQCSWLIVLLLFCLCVALKLNGSSVGMWEQELSGRKASKGLLLFEPQPVRTDEWLVWTPAALSQARHRARRSSTSTSAFRRNDLRSRRAETSPPARCDLDAYRRSTEREDPSAPSPQRLQPIA